MSGNYTGTKGEYLPSTPQVLNFRLSVRDNKMGGGGLCYSNYTVNIDQNGPFAVTYPSVPGIFWLTGTQQTVTWDVNGTDFIPFNCDSVRISISMNSGLSYSVLVASTPNDGNELINVPLVGSSISTCKIQVEGKGKNFYDMSNNDFTITTDVGLRSDNSDPSNPLRVWPNPAKDKLFVWVDGPSTSPSQLALRDVLGREILNFQSGPGGGNTEISLVGLENGLYFIECVQNGRSSRQRFVKD